MKLFLAIALALLLPAAALADPPSYQQNCRTWLALVDASKFDESWDAASDYFKSKVTKEQWGPLIKAARDTSGDPMSRGSAEVTQTDTLPGAPFGQYLVIVIHTKFTINQNATETVIMKLESGEWKVAGYFIK